MTDVPDDAPDDGSEPADADPGRADREIKPLTDEDIRDALPEDLDAAGYVGPYLFPNNNRRRIPGIIYLVLAVGCLVLWVTHRDGSVLVNAGFLAAAVGLALFGTYSIVAGWNLEVDERDALVASVRTVGFPVGHASAQLAWRGLRSRPVWRVLLYSADEPPSKRGLVELDAVDGEILGTYTEDNPEDWSAYGFSSGGSPPASAS